jgi:hypothetical protein
VNWATVTRPKDLGGLGIPDLDKFGRALRLRWLWQEWVDDTKPWAGMDTPTDDTDRALFTTSTRVVVASLEMTIDVVSGMTLGLMEKRHAT